jgi:hypothetical protein
MPDAEHLGTDSVTERELFALELESPEALPATLGLSSPRFACLVAWDARDVEAARIARFARKLIDAGAVYVCAWGPDCERVHDIIDEEEIGPNPPLTVDRVVMTTWHANDSLAEAIWFVLHNSWPDEGYEEGCASTLGVAIGSAQWASEIRDAFSRPREFASQVLGNK